MTETEGEFMGSMETKCKTCQDTANQKLRIIYSSNNSQHYLIKEGDPLSAKMIYIADFSFVRGDWHVQTKSKLIVTCDEDFFFLKANISGIENNQIIYSRDWDVKVPRLVY